LTNIAETIQQEDMVIVRFLSTLPMTLSEPWTRISTPFVNFGSHFPAGVGAITGFIFGL